MSNLIYDILVNKCQIVKITLKIKYLPNIHNLKTFILE